MTEFGRKSSVFWAYFCGILTLVFVLLKLLGIIEFSWLWVFSPLWIPVAVFTVILAFIFLWHI